MSAALQFPSCLFGSTASTRAAWKRIARTAWSDGTWRKAFEQLDLRRVDEDDKPIVVWTDQRIGFGRGEEPIRNVPWSARSEMWHMNWIAEEHPAPLNQLIQRAAWHADLYLEGLEHMWFSVGVLQGDPRHLPFVSECYHKRGEQYKRRLMALVKSFIRWLPDLAKLEGRLVIARGNREVEPVSLASRLGMFLDWLDFAGVPVSQQDMVFVITSPTTEALERVFAICDSIRPAQ